MQPALPKKKRGIGDYINWGLIGFAVVLALALIAWLIIELTGSTSSDTGKTQKGVAAVLEPDSSAPFTRTISSTLGVKIPYNARELEGFGFADEVTFANTDLDESRAYTIMRVRPVETSEATRSEVTLESPELRVTSSLSKGYWDMLSTKKEYKDLSKIDMLVKETVSARTKDKMVQAADTEVKNINNIDYRKVTFTTTNKLYGVETVAREDCYMTVQNDRPYVGCIDNIRSSNFSVVPQLEAVLTGITYDGLDKKVLVDATEQNDDASMLQAKEGERADSESAAKKTDDDESTSAKKLPAAKQPAVSPYLADTYNFKSFATAVPATVRVGTVYCADVKLSLPDGGDGPTLTGACVDKAGTGFFVSQEGIIATSGSVVQVKPQEAIAAYVTNAPDSSQALDRLQRLLDYLVTSRSIMQSDADALIAGVQERNQDIIAKVNALSTLIAPEDIAITKEKYTYAVQLADKPIVVNQNGDGSSSFAYTDTVIDASIEAKDYSADISQQQIYDGQGVKGDTALLRTKNTAIYPALKLAYTGDGIADKSVVNIEGLPMYAFGSLASAQFRPTPLYRSGLVSQTFSASEGQKVRSVTTSSHAGLAGAPALDTSGKVVGVATYNNLNCPDRKCFASTVIRDTSAITLLAKQRNMILHDDSSSSTVWNEALTQLTRGNYRQASQLFSEAASLYPQNYLAAKYADYSKSQYGTATDTSTMNTVVSILQMLSVVAVGVLILLGIAKTVFIMILRPRTETQYGQMAGGSYIDPSQWQHQHIGTTAPGVTQATIPPAPLPQPTQWQPSAPTSPVQPQSPGYEAPSQQSYVQSPTNQGTSPVSPQPPQQSNVPPTWPPQPPVQQ